MTVMYASRRYAQQYNNVALATLKLTIVVMYAFIDVPYLYLFYTSSFISLILITGLSDSQDSVERSSQ